MKTLKQILRSSLSLRGMAVAALLLGASAQTSRAASADPSMGSSFTWDLISSGSGQRGMAFITFSNDGTFRGYQLLAALPSNTNLITIGRGGEGVGRGGTGGNTNTIVKNIVFGFGPIDGTWTRNSRGKILGFFSEALNVTSIVTNYFASTNTFFLVNNQNGLDTTNVTIAFTNGQASAVVTIAWPDPPPVYNQQYTLANANFTTQVGTAENTNVVSFSGTSTLGKRLTLLCNTTFGKVTFTGLAAKQGANVSGNWIGNKKENGHPQNEFFSLASFDTGNPFPSDFPDIANFPNMYFTTNGVGAGYVFNGVAMVSRQKKMGFIFVNDTGAMRTMMGPIRPTKFGPTAKTKGIEEPLNLVNFTATLQ